MRVILLLKNQKQEETKLALQLGIYDIIYGNFYPSQIKEVIERPNNFRDIADLYRKTFNIKLKKRKRIRDDKSNSFLVGFKGERNENSKKNNEIFYLDNY